MLKKKPLQFYMRLLPIIILLFISFYFIYNAWTKYESNTEQKLVLVNASKLQILEYSLLNELLCVSTMTQASGNILKICEQNKKTTDDLLIQYKSEKQIFIDAFNEIESIRKNMTGKSIDDLQSLLGGSQDKEAFPLISKYFSQLESSSNIPEEKELLRLYSRMGNISLMTELEKVLVSYYLSKEIPISLKNFVYWEKIVALSYFPELENEAYVPSIKESLLQISNNKQLQNTLSKIDDMRIEILLNGHNAKYTKSNVDWISILNKKQNALHTIESLILREVNTLIDNRMQRNIWVLVFFVLVSVLAVLFLYYVLRDYLKQENENRSLEKVIHSIQNLPQYSPVELKAMNQILNEVETKEDIYNYVDTCFHLLHEKSKQIEDEVEAKSQFFSTLSHEIRTPLNGIIGFTKLLKTMGASKDQEEFLSLIEKSSQNLVTIVNDVLDLSKINAAKMELENTSFDIFETIESIVATFSQQSNQKDIELALFIDPFLTHNFLGDSTKLSQILINLISNAIKFTDAYGKINVFVQSMHQTEDEARIKFAVQDNGIGLSPEEEKNIFAAYGQASKSTSNKYGGTGLGLTISRKIVELMGGNLDVESEQNVGSTFFFTLVLKKDKEHGSKLLPNFSDISVGLALPVKSIKRQLDTNLEIYIRHLGAEFSIYYYEDLFESDGHIELPDLMIFDHHYARLPGEIEMCSALKCNSILLTNANLQSRINPALHQFSDIIFAPIGLTKTIRILRSGRTKITETDTVRHTIESIPSFEGLHALVADDYAINRKLIKIILEKMGLTVTLASDGSKAVQMRKKNDYDIIFMDIQMPIMDGVIATKNILSYEREHQLRHVPIIALTANTLDGHKESYLSEGMDAYLSKPIDIDLLKTTISDHCVSMV